MTGAIWALIIVAYSLSWFAERRLSNINRNFLMFGGAQEILPKLMWLYYRVLFLAIPGAWFEYWTQEVDVSLNAKMLALSCVLIGFGLRTWAIRELGWQWSFYCLVFPGTQRVTKGPYRFLKHPEYASRLLDGCGIFLFLGAEWTAGIYVATMLICSLIIINREEQQFSCLEPVENLRLRRFKDMQIEQSLWQL